MPKQSDKKERADIHPPRLARGHKSSTLVFQFVHNPAMQEGQPSRTAFRVAMRRAAHQLFDHPPVLVDPIAVLIIGADAKAKLKNNLAAFRAFMAVRSRFAEDALARAVGRGVGQYVILGAGFDTFAYRNPYPESMLNVFEVDHPATQAWKRKRLAAAEIAIPSSLTFVGVDFESQTVAARLVAEGFDLTKPAFFSWLGVTMYLRDAVVMDMFDFIASIGRGGRGGRGGGVAFDYAVPRKELSFLERLVFDRLSARVTQIGEPFQTFYSPQELVRRLRQRGFTNIEDLGSKEINGRHFSNRKDRLRVRGALGRLMSAELPLD